MDKFSISSIVSVNKETVYCSIEEEVVILDIKDGIYYGLNPVGAFVWNLIGKPKKIEEIFDAILEEFNVNEKKCKNDLMELINELLNKGLIEVSNDNYS